jgi:hypothetical protein
MIYTMIKLKDLMKEGTENNSRIIQIASSTNKAEIEKIKNVLLNADWTEKEINDAVKKRKEIDDEVKSKTAEALPKKQKDWTYDQATSDKYKDARADWIKKYGTKSWNDRSYNKWIKDMASNGGRTHSYDMAQNAKNERGLIDYVKKQIKSNYGDETPLERIQWDIEAA